MCLSYLVVLMPLGASLVGAAPVEDYDLPSYAHLREKIDAGEDITVLYFGGSITVGAMTWPQHGTNAAGEAYDYRGESDPERFSWRARTFAWLREHYEKRPGQFRMVNAAVGATDSELGAYRLADHVLANHPDLLFIEFAINDNGAGRLSDDPEADGSIYRRLSSIISRVREANPNAAVFLPVSAARDLKPEVPAYFETARAHHKRFAEMYHVPYLDICKVFFEDPLPEGVTRENVFDGPDNPGCAVHPSPRGHQAFAEAVCRALDGLLTSHRFPFAQPRREDWFAPYPVNPAYVTADKLPTGEGWSLRDGTAFAHLATHVCHETKVLFTDQSGAKLVLPFSGSSVYMWGQQHYAGLGDISGRLQVSVDGEVRACFADADHREPGDQLLQRMMPVVRDLDPSEPHVLEIVTVPPPDGVATRIGLYGIGLDQPTPSE